MPPKFSLVVPTYNERSNITELYRRIVTALDSLPFDSEIIFVDGNSPDLTWQAAQDFWATVNTVRSIALPKLYFSHIMMDTVPLLLL